MTTADILQLLQGGVLEIEGLLPWSSNYTFLMRVCNETTNMAAVYKPRRGERPLWDFAQGTLCQRERAAFLVSDALGWDLVPPTVIREGPHGAGSLQLFVEHDPEIHYFTFEGDPLYKTQLQRIVLFDILINNADRKSGHVLMETPADESDTHGRLWAIDHGVSFHSDYKLRTVVWEFANAHIPQNLLLDLIQLKQTLSTCTTLFYKQLRELLTDLEIAALQKRLEKLIKKAVFPQPGPGRHYPWPPV